MTSPDPDSPDHRDAPASFGYRAVDPAEKPSLVRGVFESVAPRYDVMNDLMSGGIHRLWKTSMIDWLQPRTGQRFIDVAGGTGDVAVRILARLGDAVPESQVVVCDLTPSMLVVGRDRAIDRGILSCIDWVAGDAEDLPFADRSFDAYTIAFGLRNVTHINRALGEARRVIKPGGRFLCLEFSQVVVPMLDRLYDLYSFRVLPALGQIVTGDRDAYQYLVESIRRFPKQADLAGRIAEAGLAKVKVRNLTGGIAALHSAWRI
ncbi:MAG: bifunctional demethylmenaquinone methyltransferase/2-methoxy-6-polyprenyl-1,4-benzoquinol methylase UbiE [Dongiaceae bacterium]